MSSTQILVLGAIAGLTIFLGLPLGRIRRPAPRVQAFLNALAVGILVFLLVEVFEHGFEPIEEALLEAVDEGGSWATFVGYAILGVLGLAAGLLGLVYYERWMRRRRPPLPAGPGAASVAELRAGPLARLTEGHRLALLIAVGIGLHNFAEGLAIGQSAAQDELTLAVALVVGFGLHNATEGFGIVAPLTTEARRPTWGFLALLGLIGGGPTFVGTLIGQSWVSDAVFVVFLGLAAGSILYVVLQLLKVGFRLGYAEVLAWGVLAGLVLGFGTELVVAAAGG